MTPILTLLLLINLSRINLDSLQPVKLDPILSFMAIERAKQVENFSSKDFQKHKGWDYTKNYPCTFILENLARNFSSITKTHIALMNSPSHREAILSPAPESIGIGIYKSIVVEWFCIK